MVPFIKIFLFSEPVLLKCDEGEVLVTAFPAYHCPGSVMFVLQNKQVTVLYTGDIRFRLKNDIEKMVMLKQYQFDEIYLDSTFFRRDYLDFPSQQDSVDQICTLIEDWLWKDGTNKIYLDTSARYGYEYLFIEIFKKIKKRICVPMAEFNKYRHIPELDEATTCDQNASIHAIRTSFFMTPHMNEPGIRRIKISAMRWKQWKDGNDISKKNGRADFFVCYSNHSSFNEICNFLKLLKPKAVFFNCVPKDDPNALSEMHESLKEVLSEIHSDKLKGKTKGKQESEKSDQALTVSLMAIPKSGSKRRVEYGSMRPIPVFKKRCK